MVNNDNGTHYVVKNQWHDIQIFTYSQTVIRAINDDLKVCCNELIYNFSRGTMTLGK